MRRIRRRKVLYGSMLSLIILMSFSLSCLISSATILEDDASLVVSRLPILQKGWYRTTPSIATNTYSDSFFSSDSYIGASTASYLWRLFNYFDFPVNETITPRQQWLVGWAYDSTLDFNLEYVYSFEFEIRLTGMGSLASDPVPSKLLLCFPTNHDIGLPGVDLFSLHDITQTQLTNNLLATFAPSSYQLVGSAIRVTYNIGIYPETLFSGAYIETDSDTGVRFIPLPCLFLWNNEAFSYTPQVSPNGQFKRIEASILPYSSGASFRVYTPDEWSTHVQEQGFNDLSLKIDQATGTITQAIDNQTSTIVGSIEDAADDIINAGDPVDFSGLDNYHNQESALIDNILSTAPYDPDDAAAIFSTSNWATLLKGATFTNNWYNYVFANNSLIGFLLTLGMAFAVAHQALKGLL